MRRGRRGEHFPKFGADELVDGGGDESGGGAFEHVESVLEEERPSAAHVLQEDNDRRRFSAQIGASRYAQAAQRGTLAGDFCKTDRQRVRRLGAEDAPG